MLKEIVEKCQINKLQPWDVEIIHYTSDLDLVANHFLTEEEQELLISCSDKQLKALILDTYYSNTQPVVLPEHIEELINQAKQETDDEGWSLTRDWFVGIHDYHFDDEMSKYITNYRKAKQVYGYILVREFTENIWN